MFWRVKVGNVKVVLRFIWWFCDFVFIYGKWLWV